MLRLLLPLGIVLALLAVWSITQAPDGQHIRYDQFRRHVAEGRVKSVRLGPSRIEGEYRAGSGTSGADGTPRFRTERVSDDPSLIQLLDEHGVTYTGSQDLASPLWPILLYTALPILLLLFLFGRMGRMGKDGGGPAGAFSFAKSKGKVVQEKDVDVTFADVAGIEEAKGELREVIDFLKTPERFTTLGAKIPKGLLLVGPPGTGKTLLARAVAGEAGVPFISINGSEFVELFVGVGAARVRDLFEQASKSAPCIVFIDELDAIGRSRGGTALGGGSNEEREQTLNQLLVEMDGFNPRKAVIIMSATNRPEILDPALLRPGRFDRQVLVDRPDRRGRVEILKVHTRGVPLDDQVNLEEIAAQTPGFAGADLANLVNEAALLAARRGRQKVGGEDLAQAIDRVVAGLERRSRIIGEDERRRIAVHEVGHAICSKASGSQEVVQKISIVPRGMSALGYTRKMPTEERYLMTESAIDGLLVGLLGGRAAEKLVYGETSTGAADDLQRATDIARAMVIEYGMSPKLGPVTLGDSPISRLSGTPLSPTASQRYGSAVADTIDTEIRRIVEQAEAAALGLLRRNRPLLDKIAGRLLESEHLEGEELTSMLADVQMLASTSAPPEDVVRIPS